MSPAALLPPGETLPSSPLPHLQLLASGDQAEEHGGEKLMMLYVLILFTDSKAKCILTYSRYTFVWIIVAGECCIIHTTVLTIVFLWAFGTTVENKL